MAPRTPEQKEESRRKSAARRADPVKHAEDLRKARERYANDADYRARKVAQVMAYQAEDPELSRKMHCYYSATYRVRKKIENADLFRQKQREAKERHKKRKRDAGGKFSGGYHDV